MIKNNFTLILATIMATTGSAMAEEASPITANIGVVSNYMWRGITQDKDSPAIQGGLDYVHESGFSLGTWVSNVDFGTVKPTYEMDFYGGYGGKMGDLGYNLTTTYYAYPDGDTHFWELGASSTWNVLTVGLAYGLDGVDTKPAVYRDGDLYYYATLAFDLPYKLKLNGTLGHTDFNDFGSAADYTNWQVSVSKDAGDFGTVSLNYDQNDGGIKEILAIDNDPKFWIGWKKIF